MTLDEYQRMARAYRLPSANEAYALFGLIGEIGEVYSLLAKGIRDDKPFTAKEMSKELGDVLWFVAAVADDIDLCLDDIAQGNIDKLSSRSARGVLQGSGDDR